MNSYVDDYGRVITPINPKPGDPKIVLAEPAEADELLDVLDSGGIQPFVMNFGTGSPLFLAFKFNGTVTLDALDAAQRLTRRFEADAELREVMVVEALQDGTAFHEWVRARRATTWRDPGDDPTAS